MPIKFIVFHETGKKCFPSSEYSRKPVPGPNTRGFRRRAKGLKYCKLVCPYSILSKIHAKNYHSAFFKPIFPAEFGKLGGISCVISKPVLGPARMQLVFV